MLPSGPTATLEIRSLRVVPKSLPQATLPSGPMEAMNASSPATYGCGAPSKLIWVVAKPATMVLVERSGPASPPPLQFAWVGLPSAARAVPEIAAVSGDAIAPPPKVVAAPQH